MIHETKLSGAGSSFRLKFPAEQMWMLNMIHETKLPGACSSAGHPAPSLFGRPSRCVGAG